MLWGDPSVTEFAKFTKNEWQRLGTPDDDLDAAITYAINHSQRDPILQRYPMEEFRLSLQGFMNYIWVRNN